MADGITNEQVKFIMKAMTDDLKSKLHYEDNIEFPHKERDFKKGFTDFVAKYCNPGSEYSLGLMIFQGGGYVFIIFNDKNDIIEVGNIGNCLGYCSFIDIDPLRPEEITNDLLGSFFYRLKTTYRIERELNLNSIYNFTN